MSFLHHLAALASIFTLVLGFAPAVGADEEVPDTSWNGSIGVGGAVTSGNVDSFNGSIAASAEKVWDVHTIRLDLLASYGKADGDINTDRQTLTEYYRHDLTDRFYAYVDAVQERNSVQNINFRLLLNVGPGWRAWVRGEKQFLELEAGIGYRFETYAGPSSVNFGDPDDFERNDGTGRVAFLYANLFGAAEFSQSGEYLLPLNDTSAWLARAATNLSLPITDSWSFNNTLLLEYLNKPVAGNDEFNLEYIVALAYEF